MPQVFEPVPDMDAQAHSARLVTEIHGAIRRAGGALGFDDYMRLALYAPGLGYYSAGAQKFGESGDFVTAPELSSLFGETLADLSAQALDQLGGGVVLEIGAGSGVLAESLLAGWPQAAPLPEAYLVLEVSGELRARQQQRLARLPPALRERVHWLDGWPSRPVRGVVIANEVMDALPVQRFRVGPAGIEELVVRSEGAGFAWATRAADAGLAGPVAALLARLPQPWPDGYVSEYSPDLGPWLAGLADSLATGLVVLLDYGGTEREYYHPERREGTLTCHYRHRAHGDPFLFPGLQDITAWVDFSAAATAAAARGLDVAGYLTQAAFLVAAGFPARFATKMEAGGPAGAATASAARRLLLPGEMGERVKALLLARGFSLPVTFAAGDQRYRL